MRAKFEYYYDLEEVYLDRAAYVPKATSAGITASGYAQNDDSDDEEQNSDEVPRDISAILDADGCYNTPTDRSRLTSDSSNALAKKRRMNLKKSSNKSVRSSNTSSAGTPTKSFDAMATHYTNYWFGPPAVSIKQKSKIVVAAEDAATVSTRFKTCVDNFGSLILAA